VDDKDWLYLLIGVGIGFGVGFAISQLLAVRAAYMPQPSLVDVSRLRSLQQQQAHKQIENHV